MGWNLPDGCTNEDVDRAAGGYEEEDIPDELPAECVTAVRRPRPVDPELTDQDVPF